MRILIVADDDADVGELEQVLTQAGYTTCSAHVTRSPCVTCAPPRSPSSCCSTCSCPKRPPTRCSTRSNSCAISRRACRSPILARRARGARPSHCDGRRDFVTSRSIQTSCCSASATRCTPDSWRAAGGSRRAAQRCRPQAHLRARQRAPESLTVLASIAEYHDDDTYQHTQRVGVSAARIAQALELPDPFVATIRDAAPLHDIGKVGISRRILLKPGQLTPAEWVHMTRHVEIGAQSSAPPNRPRCDSPLRSLAPITSGGTVTAISRGSRRGHPDRRTDHRRRRCVRRAHTRTAL